MGIFFSKSCKSQLNRDWRQNCHLIEVAWYREFLWRIYTMPKSSQWRHNNKPLVDWLQIICCLIGSTNLIVKLIGWFKNESFCQAFQVDQQLRKYFRIYFVNFCSKGICIKSEKILQTYLRKLHNNPSTHRQKKKT